MAIEKDTFLNDKSCEKFFKLKNLQKQLCIDDFNRFHKNLIDSDKNDRKKWLLINEIVTLTM